MGFSEDLSIWYSSIRNLEACQSSIITSLPNIMMLLVCLILCRVVSQHDDLNTDCFRLSRFGTIEAYL